PRLKISADIPYTRGPRPPLFSPPAGCARRGNDDGPGADGPAPGPRKVRKRPGSDVEPEHAELLAPLVRDLVGAPRGQPHPVDPHVGEIGRASCRERAQSSAAKHGCYESMSIDDH